MSVGGPAVMVLGALVAALVCVLLALLTQRRLGTRTAWAAAGLVWSLVVVALVTLLPATGPPGVIPAAEAQTSCSFDFGGPAPEGFWILGGGQRALNTALFVPAGAMLVILVGRRRTWWLAAPGVALLAAYSVGIEWTQLELARLDRACDVTDVVDNVTGALLGAALGVLVAAALAAVTAVGRRRRARRRR